MNEDRIGRWRITPRFLAAWLGVVTLYILSWNTLIVVCAVWTAIVAVDCAQHETSVGNDKLTWVLIILLIPFFGPTYYWFFRRPFRGTNGNP